MAVTAGALTKTLVGNSTALLTSAVATAGTGPYTYQWYQSTTTGFTAGAGNLVAGATALVQPFSGLIPGTAYFYKVIATDTGAGNATSTSTQLAVTTEPSLSPNQFSQGVIVGAVDMKVGSTNIISCAVDNSVASSTTNPAIFPGQGVKIVSNTVGGLPRVAPITSKSDQVIGFCIFNQKDISYVVGDYLEIAMFGSVVWLYATGAVTQFAEVCLDPTYIGGVQATGATATMVGWAMDGSAAGGMVRVMLLPNPSFATA